MLPEPDGLDAEPAKPASRVLVSLPVTVDLRLPKSGIGARNMATSRAPVPEAAVDENSQAGAGKVKIRFSGHIRRVHRPTTEAGPHHAGAQPDFRRSVSSTANGGHISRSAFWHVFEFASRQYFPESSLHSFPYPSAALPEPFRGRLRKKYRLSCSSGTP